MLQGYVGLGRCVTSAGLTVNGAGPMMADEGAIWSRNNGRSEKKLGKASGR